MNNYGNKFGFHSPKRTEKALSKMQKETKIDFYDSSYKNDLCDSIEHEYSDDKFLKIFIPNSKKSNEDKEQFNTYFVSSEDLGIEEFFSTLKEVILFILNIDFNIDDNY
jgi:hypothetical protein